MRWILLIICLLLFPINSWSSQQDQIKEGNKFYHEKKWDEAIDKYFNALEGGKNEDIVNYNLGSAFYKKGDYDKAIENYSNALKSKDMGLNKNANYNLANAKFQQAKNEEAKDINRAIEGMKSSIQHYDETLKLNPKDQDAAYNRKIVEEEIKRLEKKKKDQQNNSDQSKQNQNNQNQDKQQSKDQKQKDNQPNSNKDQSESKDDQQNASSQKKQEDQKSSASKGSQEDSKNKKDQQNSAQQGESKESAKEQGVKKQAQQILNDYERQEAPKGLLHFIKRTQGEDHVDKDW